MKDLLGAVAIGVAEEDLFLSLANRLLRLEKQLTDKEKENLVEHAAGRDIKQLTTALIGAYDQDVIDAHASTAIDKIPVQDRTPALIAAAKKDAQAALITTAAKPFTGELNAYLENVRKQHDQIIDAINIDTVTKSEWDTTSLDKAKSVVKDFTDYLQEHKDEIQALSIFYNQPYQRRDITFKMIKEVMEKIKLEKPILAPDYVWAAYAQLEAVKGTAPKDELTALVSLIRRACGIDAELKAYDKTIEANFNKWVFDQHTGNRNRFTPEQLDWLRMIKEHVVSSYHMQVEDLDYNPFDAQGGKGKMHQLFGKEMNNIIDELNEILAA
jgi:type I restriction enzyme R subunit